MSKQKKITEKVEDTVNTVAETEQAVEKNTSFAKSDDSTSTQVNQEDLKVDKTKKEPVSQSQTQEKIIVQKSGGKGLAFLALIIALGVGGAGYFFGEQRFSEVENRLQALSAQATQQNSQPIQSVIEMPTFDAEKAQLSELATSYQKAIERLNQLESEQSAYTQSINSLQLELQKLNGSTENKSVWLLSDADFLLNNAARKIVLDNDIDTAKALLIEADGVLSQVPSAANVREAIKADLNILTGINKVDQNALMHRLADLANNLDDLPILENESDATMFASGEISDSIDDWQQNLEKSANSFLDNFIRISDKGADEKAFVAPNQEIYLRENIRLRLQIAILAIPRQQHELYTKSLQAVATWVRSYFDTNNDNVKNFLKELDELAEQSIYIDAPKHLQSLKLLEQQINKVPQQIEKIEIKAEKELAQEEAPKPVEQPQPDSQIKTPVPQPEQQAPQTTIETP